MTLMCPLRDDMLFDSLTCKPCPTVRVERPQPLMGHQTRQGTQPMKDCPERDSQLQDAADQEDEGPQRNPPSLPPPPKKIRLRHCLDADSKLPHQLSLTSICTVFKLTVLLWIFLCTCGNQPF